MSIFSVLVGFVIGVVGTLAVISLFAFGPRRLQNGGAAVIRFLLWLILPFGIIRHSYLRISASPVDVNGEHRSVIRIDPRHELVLAERHGRYSFSLWHLVPVSLVIWLCGLLARFSARSTLGYGARIVFTGSLLRIDRNVSIFTLDAASIAKRKADWARH
jgi:hypothetical protein